MVKDEEFEDQLEENADDQKVIVFFDNQKRMTAKILKEYVSKKLVDKDEEEKFYRGIIIGENPLQTRVK